MTTIAARDVADAVGLPPVWAGDTGWCVRDHAKLNSIHPKDLPWLGHADPQTAFGVALRLDAWERAKRDREGFNPWESWVGQLGHIFATFEDPAPDLAMLLPRMAARITHIAQSNRIRRALGEEPKPGTLADFGLMQPHEQWWRFDARQHGGAFIEWDRDGVFIGSAKCGRRAPSRVALADITDPTEALAAIDAALGEL